MITKMTPNNNQEYYAPRFAYISQELQKRDDLVSYLREEGHSASDELNPHVTYLTEAQYEGNDVVSSVLDEETGLFRTEFKQDSDNFRLERHRHLTIDSLESYYANITDISALYTRSTADGTPLNNGYLLLVVPADEEYFEINANTRTITVPAAFKKNGVGVNGDHNAEILVFKIDRYFDYQDLDLTKIAINWNFTPAGSRTATIEASHDAFAPNVELEPGYVVFGFIVTKDMCPSKGTLNFSVTFYKTDSGDGNYSYALNTQNASVAINDGLILKDPKETKNTSKNILTRLQNSSYDYNSIGEVATPGWRTGEYDSEARAYLGLPAQIDFVTDADGFETIPVEVRARAYGDGLGGIQYSWYGTPLSGNAAVEREEESQISNGNYYPIGKIQSFTNVEANHAYYYTNDNGKTYKVINSKSELDNLKAEDPELELYEFGSSFNINYAGQYVVNAQAFKIVNTETSTFSKSSGIAQSNICIVPPAAKPNIALTIEGGHKFNDGDACQKMPEHEDRAVKDATLNPTGELEYFYIDKEVADDEQPKIQAQVTVANEGDILGGIAAELVLEDDLHDLTQAEIEAQAKKSKDDDAGSYKYNFVKANQDNNLIDVAADNLVEGVYRARAINRHNNTYSVSDVSAPLVTSYVATPVTKLNVSAVKNNVNVLIEGNRPEDAVLAEDGSLDTPAIKLTETQPVENFIIEDVTPADEKCSDEVLFFVQEMYWDATAGQYKERGNVRPEGAPASVPDLDAQPDEFPVELNREGKLAFEINYDGGFYRIKSVNYYHGTVCTAYTDVFKVIAQ